ncbi:MAG TPA: glycosyltransferase, partial [Nocardioides sp.]|nr:glycosyltransferase [Nocardioides sp.]
MSRRIVAVVVTYNRLALLAGLIDRLREVPECDEILVIDNASTDGTGDWLADQTDVIGHTLPTNTGGAGGFHEGLRLAMERGADLAWLMDDDGRPEVGTLGQLLEVDGYDFWGPLVVDEDKPDELVFPIRLPGSARVVRDVASATAAAAGGVLEDIVIPFNGVLVTKELVAQIGLPRAEFFIWGDDHEFRLRAEKAGARIGTVVEARFTHPSVGELGTPMWGGRSTYNHTPSDLKHYCMARNNLLNLATYRSPVHALAFVLKTLWFYAITRPDAGRIRLSAMAWTAALRGDFTGHRRFLESASSSSRAVTPRHEFGHETTAVVVVTYNRAGMLKPMLEGLERLDPAPQAVLVVDNASTDETPEVLAASRLSGLRVIRSEENLGGAGGFRTGMQAA